MAENKGSLFWREGIIPLTGSKVRSWTGILDFWIKHHLFLTGMCNGHEDNKNGFSQALGLLCSKLYECECKHEQSTDFLSLCRIGFRMKCFNKWTSKTLDILSNHIFRQSAVQNLVLLWRTFGHFEGPELSSSQSHKNVLELSTQTTTPISTIAQKQRWV